MSEIEYSFDGTILFVFPRSKDALDLQNQFIEFEDHDFNDLTAKFNKSGQCVLILNAKISKEINDRNKIVSKYPLPYSLIEKTKLWKNEKTWEYKPEIYLISNIAIHHTMSLNNQFQAEQDETGKFRITKLSKSALFETFYHHDDDDYHSYVQSYSKEFIIQQILLT